jgi:small-conductance mechanosensitive channel
MFQLNRFFKSSILLLAVLLGLLWGSETAVAKDKSAVMLLPSSGSKKTQEKSDKTLPEIPENLNKEKINEIVAGLSDDQVRRLLIRELELAAEAAKAAKQTAPAPSGVARLAQMAEENISLFNKRLADIRSGAVAVPDFLPKAYADLRGKGGAEGTFLMFVGILALLAAGVGAEWLFRRAVWDIRSRLITSPPDHWMVRIKRLLLWGLLEVFSICVFCAATVGLFFLFFNRSPFARLVVMMYLIVVLAVRGISLVLRFLLVPDSSSLRWVPLEDNAARYLYRWIMAIVLVLGVGFLIRGLLELQGISEEGVVFIRSVNAAIILAMLVYLIFDNRQPVARIICHGTGEPSSGKNLLRSQVAAFWHWLALPYLVLLWCLWVFYLLVGQSDLVIPMLALLSSPLLFILFNGFGQKLLSTLVGFVDQPEAEQQPCESGEGSDAQEPAAPADRKTSGGSAHVSRVVPILRSLLSFSIAGLIFFWMLGMWGIEVHVGEEVMGAALKILLVISIAYVAWRVIEAAINRKLKEVQGSYETDEDSEAGGTGGSRIGTLLQLFRKFLLVVLLVIVALIVLSALGIDTKPLLAGAGILGLAIGLGTQNLIKDIVSGLFFLIDDAFRIGDYVESGKAKGTVEAISVRSLKLRHTRGMVHIVPFNQLGSVTNFSRDYNITKLDFRVPFDTDVDKVRKVVKKIDKEIQQDEEMGPNLLGPIKCTGVLALDDSALIMRVKFKSKPGLQFTIQRQVFRRLKELFDEKGLEFATRHVMVRLPDEAAPEKPIDGGELPPETKAGSKKGPLSAAAGAAIASALAQEEAQRKLMQQNAEES